MNKTILLNQVRNMLASNERRDVEIISIKSKSYNSWEVSYLTDGSDMVHKCTVEDRRGELVIK